MFEKHLWKSDILSKDPGHRPKSLLKMSLFHRCFSNILLVKTNHLVYPYVEHWSEMGWSKPLTKWFPVLLRTVHGMHPRDDNLSSHKMYILRHGKLSPLPLERIHTSWKTDLFVDFTCWNREKKQTREPENVIVTYIRPLGTTTCLQWRIYTSFGIQRVNLFLFLNCILCISLRVVIILFSTGLCKPTFCTYLFVKTRFSSICVLVFRVSVFLIFSSKFFCSLLWTRCQLKRLNKICIIREFNQTCAL